MFSTFLTGTLIAISFSAPPGPVAMETIRRGMRGGFRSALHVQLGSIVGDCLWFMIALIGLGTLTQINWIKVALAVCGIGVLLYLGAIGIHDALKANTFDRTDLSNSTGSAFRSGMAISIANPMAVGYWLSVGGALAAAGIANTTPLQTGAFVSGFIGGTFAWAFIMALIVRWGQRILKPNIFRSINFACGAALLIFGLSLASQLLSS
jgi:chemosensory pili system protein ChpE